MWSAMPPAGNAATAIIPLILSLQRGKKCYQVRNVLRREAVRRRIRHRSHAAGISVLQNHGHVLGRRRLTVDQVRVRGIVENVREPGADERLIEGRQLVAGRALLGEERLTGRCVASLKGDRATACRGQRVADVRVLLLPRLEPPIEDRLLVDHEVLLVHLAVEHAAELGADDVVAPDQARRELDRGYETWDRIVLET